MNGITNLNNELMDTTATINEIEIKMNVNKLIKQLGKEYNRIYNKDIPGFQYYNYANTSMFVCFMSRGILMQVHKRNFIFYSNKYLNHPVLNVKVKEYKDSKVLIVSEKKPFFSTIRIRSNKKFFQ